MILVYGGSGSGKSAWAERTLLGEAARVTGSRAVYLATMETDSSEAAARIARHRNMREQHGVEAGVAFVTEERCVDIGGADVMAGDFVLLEDLGNLLANEIWSSGGVGVDGAPGRILSGVSCLLERAKVLVVVSNDVFSSGERYDEGTMRYIRILGKLHRELARMAGQVVEVICGIPVCHKV